MYFGSTDLSSQQHEGRANGPFQGGQDGRDRMSSIDTKKCTMYMLTGEYDWNNTPAMAQATCDKIPGGKHQAMKGLGHFPATNNLPAFVPYRERDSMFAIVRACSNMFAVLEAVEHIQKAIA
jgi:hypothetical protein